MDNTPPQPTPTDTSADQCTRIYLPQPVDIDSAIIEAVGEGRLFPASRPCHHG